VDVCQTFTMLFTETDMKADTEHQTSTPSATLPPPSPSKPPTRSRVKGKQRAVASSTEKQAAPTENDTRTLSSPLPSLPDTPPPPTATPAENLSPRPSASGSVHIPTVQPAHIPRHRRAPSDSSSEDSADFTRIMSSSKGNMAEVIHSAPTKPPILTAGAITPETVRQFENACRTFFHNKENLADADHVARMVGGLQDPLIQDWYWNNQIRFDAMSFKDFMEELRSKWLPKDWEVDVRRKLLSTKQNGLFWEWVVRLRAWNALLRGTTHHLDETQLLNQMEANLEPFLSNAVIEEEITERDLDKWLSIVKNLDDKKRRERQQQ
jgi:hypothetical protein